MHYSRVDRKIWNIERVTDRERYDYLHEFDYSDIIEAICEIAKTAP